MTKEEKEKYKEQALLCCNLFLTEGQTALKNKLKQYTFADRLIIQLLCRVYIDIKQMRISRSEGQYRQNSILGICEIENEEE